jgi:S-adenosylmethionine decarboxylase
MPSVLYLVDLSECAAIRQLTTEEIADAFSATLASAGATILQTVAHVFPGTGLTCALLLTESHAVLHTWPETGTINLDIFSCSTGLRSLDAIAELGRLFGAGQVSIQEVPRADGHSRDVISGRA